MGPFSARFRGSTSCPTTLPSSESVTANNIRVETKTWNTISVSWTVPSDYCGPTRTYFATVTPQGSNTPLCSSTTSREYMNCTGLENSRSYNVRVITRITCNDGTSVTSDSSMAPRSYSHPCFITDPPNGVGFNRTAGVGFNRTAGVVLNWNSVSNCGNVMYNVYWSCGSVGQNNSTSSTSYTINVVNQSLFSYCLGQVQACNDQGCGRFSDGIAVLVPLGPPPDVSITGAVNGTTVLIMFRIAEPTDLDDLRYTLYRRRVTDQDDSAPFVAIRNASYNFDNVLIDTEPGAEETYEYQMELHNSIGSSSRSNTESVTTTQVCMQVISLLKSLTCFI